MKKLLIIFLLLLTTLTTVGQESPYYIRAEYFKLGEKDSNLKITWDESTFITCDVLIKLNEKEITIYSEKLQNYHAISFDGKMENGSNLWYCSDSLGKTCNIYLMNLTENPGYISLVVEYSDYVWFYLCKDNK